MGPLIEGDCFPRWDARRLPEFMKSLLSDDDKAPGGPIWAADGDLS
jgi:hypothetical protein